MDICPESYVSDLFQLLVYPLPRACLFFEGVVHENTRETRIIH